MPKCRVKHFFTPKGDQPSTVEEVPASGQVTIQCRQWTIAAVFEQGDGDACICCEYRQYIKSGPAWVLPPAGEPMATMVPTHWALTFSYPYRVRASRHRRDLWVEDTKPEGDSPSGIVRYGHRDDQRVFNLRHPLPPDMYWPECRYLGHDAPHFSPLRSDAPAGSRILIDVAFKGEILDRCSGVVVRESDPWFWKFDDVV
jgi:hypothetical protein